MRYIACSDDDSRCTHSRLFVCFLRFKIREYFVVRNGLIQLMISLHSYLVSRSFIPFHPSPSVAILLCVAHFCSYILLCILCVATKELDRVFVGALLPSRYDALENMPRSFHCASSIERKRTLKQKLILTLSATSCPVSGDAREVVNWSAIAFHVLGASVMIIAGNLYTAYFTP